MRMRRQIGAGEIDASSIEQLPAGCHGDQHGRVAVLGGADRRDSMPSCRHPPLPADGAHDNACIPLRTPDGRRQPHAESGEQCAMPHATRYFSPITVQSLAVSTYCWNRVTLPSLTSQMWQTCVSMLLPVALYAPV